ncbi:MAG TPA: RHS repeat-associated core domain-containing protein, partial [Bacteroidales bacterium]|nr:RHS repeat-associated core domain-containing protein [Bacteroidales bacterium]
ESASQNNTENNWYIYHSDHLGSSSFLTDASGDPTQHLQYLPFGENYIEQRAPTDYYTPYTFSAKERDLETGYSYFGARYYDPNVSVWISVDPMADILSWLSPYNYCELRPLRLIDPTGMLSDDPEKLLSNPDNATILPQFTVRASVSKQSSNVASKKEKITIGQRLKNTFKSIGNFFSRLDDRFKKKGGVHFYSQSGQSQETEKVGPNSDARMEKADYLAAAVGLRVPGPKPSSASPIESLAESYSSTYGAAQETEQLVENIKSEWKVSTSLEVWYANPKGFKVSIPVPDDNKKAQDFLNSCSTYCGWGNPLTIEQYQQLKKLL